METIKEAGIAAINMHIGQMVKGNVVTSLNADKHKVSMKKNDIGIDVYDGKVLLKTIPYSNIQSIDYAK